MINKFTIFSFILINIFSEFCVSQGRCVTPEEIAILHVVSMRHSEDSFDLGSPDNQEKLRRYRRLTKHTENPGSIKEAIRNSFGINLKESIEFYEQLQISKEDLKKED